MIVQDFIDTKTGETLASRASDDGSSLAGLMFINGVAYASVSDAFVWVTGDHPQDPHLHTYVRVVQDVATLAEFEGKLREKLESAEAQYAEYQKMTEGDGSEPTPFPAADIPLVVS